MSSPLTLTATHHKDTYPAISPTNPSLTQSGKTVLITGGGDGIGFEIARSFAKASATRIIIVGRRDALLEESAAKLCDEFRTNTTEFIARRGDISSDDSITSLWESLHSQNIFVHVLVLNAAHVSQVDFEYGVDTLSLDKAELTQAVDTNLVGNFLMSAKFVKQALRPAAQQLNLINVSTGSIHAHPSPGPVYATTKTAFTSLIGRIADERPVEDVQIISFHPGILYTEGNAKRFDKSVLKWESLALPADFSVWAASPEASWLHGRYVWPHWDVSELKADLEVQKQVQGKGGYLKVGVEGLRTFDSSVFLNI
ncbi:short-chain dehydrogenase/reductase [Rhodocollybia butyracea]|uniref:Short-chain dehydrogenase/reductase n=1 Tax=Rhodocollybia butyracea TaxID=206335 RepID=A0A9P5TYI0_9AGAR|nr:short-chain dehydrogenase/reductase [Rhodocollybia butyracea]